MNWVLLKNSLWVSGLTTLLAVVCGFAAALCVTGLTRQARAFALGVAVAALALPPFLVTNCWLDFLGANGSWRNWLPFDILSLGGTVWILTLLLWPIPMLAFCSAWHRLEPAQLESDVAVTGWALVRGLLFPLARGMLPLAAALVFILALNNFAVPAILQVKVSTAEMWILFNTSFDTVGALKMSLPLIVVPLFLLALASRRPVPWPYLQANFPERLFRRQLGSFWFRVATIFAIILGGLSVGLPVFQLLSVKRTWTELPGALAAGQSAIWNSFSLAAVAASLVILLSFVSLRSGATRSRFNSVVGWVLWLPFLIPGVLLGIGLITVFNRPLSSFFYQSAGIVVLAFVIRYWVLGWNGVAHALGGLDRELGDVARLTGATRWQTLRHVQWPQIAAQVAAAWYVVFLLCLWDVESMILIVPPGGETLAVRIFNLLHYGHNAQVNALCLALLGLAVAPLVGWKVWRAVTPVRRGVRLLMFGVAVLGLALATGCAPRSNSRDVPVESKLFSRAEVIGSRGVGLGQFNKPRSVAVDAQDNLYVVDMTGRVQKFSSNGVFLLSWQMPQTDLGRPKGMGRDREGNVIVVEPHYQRINFFTTDGKLVEQWGRRGTNAGELMMPRSVAVNSRDEIFVTEYGLVERVQIFNIHQGPSNTVASLASGGTNRWSAPFIKTFGRPGNGNGEFNRAEGIAVDAQDRIYVADSCNHRIQIFSSDGKFIRAHGTAGKGRGQFSYPYDVYVDTAGRQFVCEFGNGRIQVFDANDQSIDVVGRQGAEPGQLNDPWGIAFDSKGNMYVADSQNHRVQKFIRR